MISSYDLRFPAMLTLDVSAQARPGRRINLIIDFHADVSDACFPLDPALIRLSRLVWISTSASPCPLSPMFSLVRLHHVEDASGGSPLCLRKFNVLAAAGR